MSYNHLKLGFVSAPLPGRLPAQYLVAVPKRQFPNAPDRNKIKRMLREAIRLKRAHLEAFLINSQQQVAFGFQYTGREVPSFNNILEAVENLFNRYLQSDDFLKNAAELPPAGNSEDLSVGNIPPVGPQ
jgi:ribonuclease P protein component